MRTIWKQGMAVLMAAAFSACAGQSGKQAENKNTSEETPVQTTAAETEFPFPDIPALLTRPEERLTYLLKHYWEKFDFADTALVNNRNVAEQGMVNHLSLLTDEAVSEALVKESVESFCRSMEQQAHARKVFLQQIDEYLHNPDSPYRNDQLYGVYLDCMLQSKMLDEAQKSSLRFKRELIARNNPGSKATPFAYTLPDGKKSGLMQTPVEGDHLLLVFYDPECPSCHQIMEQMRTDTDLARKVKEKQLTVLAVYTEGDETVWRKDLPDMPEEWIIGNDGQEVKDRALYDLRAMPSLYLMDGQKRVILKDAPYEEIKARL